MRSDAAADGKSCEECERLRAENARLVTLLEKHGIPWEPAHQRHSALGPTKTTPN